MSMQSVRGTHDLLPEECAKHLKIIEVSREIAARFGFREMSTPLFEFSSVFKKTLGESSDIVNKEMYTFKDRNDEELTLRPEGTAGIARAFISEGLSQRTPLKIFYQGPMFRYERPQKGRQRQFHQLGVELLGVPTPAADIECIAMAHQILEKLGISGFVLEINSIADAESRALYKERLVQFLKPLAHELSEDSQKRLTTNPLRILDSKDPSDQKLLEGAPLLKDCYNEASKAFFHAVQDGLTALGIGFRINTRLVRGLDYYSHVVFEFKSSNLGAQDAILSGGRYDGLISGMGGPQTPGVGWAAGIERLALLSPLSKDWPRPVAVIPVHDSVDLACQKLSYSLRAAGFFVEQGFSGNLSKRMKRAHAACAFAAVIVGPDELQKGIFQVKNLDTSEQLEVPAHDLEGALKNLLFKTL